MKRGVKDHLTAAETEALRKDLRQGMATRLAAAKHGITQRTCDVHKAKMEGRFIAKKSKKRAYRVGTASLCNNRECVRNAVKGSDFCEDHQPAPKTPIDPAKLKKMMGGR